jgi:hypothetical protein
MSSTLSNKISASGQIKMVRSCKRGGDKMKVGALAGSMNGKKESIKREN